MDLSENKQAKHRHPWELSRTDVIMRELSNLSISGDILDIGCGDAYFDEKLISEFADINFLYGIDINLQESIHREKAHYLNNYDDINGKQFDYILLMDVIEHIEKDSEFMGSIRNYLKPNGKIIVTVPAFQSLYGIHDQELSHFRRYNSKQLRAVLNENGFHVIHWNYFYLSLLIVRFFTKNKSLKVNTWKEDEDTFKTKLFRGILNVDYKVLKALSKIGIKIGGLSLMAICDTKTA